MKYGGRVWTLPGILNYHQCSCKKRRGKEHDPDFYKVPARFRPSSAICCGGASAAGGRHSPVPADKLKPCHKVKGPGVVNSGTDKPKIGFHFWIVSVNPCWEEEVGSLFRGRLRLPGEAVLQLVAAKHRKGWAKAAENFLLWDELPALLGVPAGALVLHGLGCGTLLVKGFQSSISAAPWEVHLFLPQWEIQLQLCIPVRPETERAAWGWQEWGAGTSTAGNAAWRCKPLLASDTCIWGSQPVPQTESHQDKVENFDKWHHFILELDRISMWTEETRELKTEAATSWK